MSTYLFFSVLAFMLIFSAIITVLGAALVTLVSTFRRGSASQAAETTASPDRVATAERFFTETPSDPAPVETSSASEADQYMPLEATATDEPPEAEPSVAIDHSVIRAMEDSLACMPATFFVATDVTLALRQRVSHNGKWLKYADLPYIVLGPRRLHLIFDPEKLSRKRKASEDIDRAAYLASRFLKLRMGLDLTIRCWLVGEGKSSSKDGFRTVRASDVAAAIRKFEKSPLGRHKDATSAHFEEIVEALRACQPEDMRPLQLVM